MKTSIDYEIQHPSTLSLVWKDLCNKKPYYKIKNNTEKTITLHCITDSKHISQDFKKVGKKLNKSNEKKLTLNTTIVFNLEIKKIILGPYEKKILYYKKSFPVYWINDETNIFHNINSFKMYDKIVFGEYEEEEMTNTTSKLIPVTPNEE